MGYRVTKLLAAFIGIFIIGGLLYLAPLQTADADETVVLTVNGNGVNKEVKFTRADLLALPQKTYTYSGYNHWPGLKIFKDMTGPTLQSILDAAGLKDNATLLKFKPSGGKYVHVDYTRAQLLDEARYYFPEGEVAGDVVSWPPQRGESGKVPVETIIALNDSNGRVCFGQRAPNEPTGGDCVMIQDMYKGGVIEVTTDSLKQWPAPTANPSSGTIAAGTKVSLVKPDDVPDNVMMYYTLDGSEPSYGSRIFNISYPSFQPFLNAPIPVNQDTVIKARTIGFGKLDSDLVTFQYRADKSFVDTANHWARDNINYLAEKGVISGVTATEFKPEATVTRAQFATMLIKVLNIKPVEGAALTYQDVPGSAWYHDYIAAAVEARLLSGHSDTVFAPDANISREQMAAAIARTLKMKSNQAAAITNSEEIIKRYTDWEQISPWARPEVALAVSCGIVPETYKNTFSPGLPVTRAETAVMIYGLDRQLE